jgi:hypothetical protein
MEGLNRNRVIQPLGYTCHVYSFDKNKLLIMLKKLDYLLGSRLFLNRAMGRQVDYKISKSIPCTALNRLGQF